MPKTRREIAREVDEILRSGPPVRGRKVAHLRHHSTRAPGRKLGRIGDVNPIDYGGGYISSSPESGGPHLEYFEGLDSDERAERLSYDDDAEEKIDNLKVQLYRVDLGKDAKFLERL